MVRASPVRLARVVRLRQKPPQPPPIRTFYHGNKRNLPPDDLVRFLEEKETDPRSPAAAWPSPTPPSRSPVLQRCPPPRRCPASPSAPLPPAPPPRRPSRAAAPSAVLQTSSIPPPPPTPYATGAPRRPSPPDSGAAPGYSSVPSSLNPADIGPSAYAHILARRHLPPNSTGRPTHFRSPIHERYQIPVADSTTTARLRSSSPHGCASPSQPL